MTQTEWSKPALLETSGGYWSNMGTLLTNYTKYFEHHPQLVLFHGDSGMDDFIAKSLTV